MFETNWPDIHVHHRLPCTPGFPSEQSTSPVVYWSSLRHGSLCPALPGDDMAEYSRYTVQKCFGIFVL